MTQQLSRADKTELFSHQKDNGPFSALAVETAGLNYLDRLNRQRLDPLAPAAVRTKALHRLTALEAKLFHYIQAETPLSYFDADFQKETEQYILMRTLFLKAVDFTSSRFAAFVCRRSLQYPAGTRHNERQVGTHAPL